MRNNLFLGALSIVVVVIAWRSQIVSSAIVTDNGKLRNVNIEKLNATETWKLIENVMDDYVELSDAFHAPAPSEAVREKRTIAVFRRIWNSTRSGFQTVRSLFGGGGGSSGSSSGGFRGFFSNLLNRVLLFLTTLWDRVTGIFRGGSSGGSSGGGLFSRLAAGVTGLFSRFTGGGGGGGGGLFGGLFGGGATTTTESSFYYPESDYVYTTASTTTTTEAYDNEVLDTFSGGAEDKGKEADITASATADADVDAKLSKIEDAVGKSVASETLSVDDKEKSKITDTAKGEGGYPESSGVSGGYGSDFIPFPGDAENVADFRSSRSMSPSVISAVFPIRSESKYYPHVVQSPGILHTSGEKKFLIV